VIEVLLNQLLGPGASGVFNCVCAQFIVAVAVLACGWNLWKIRKNQANTKEFGSATALVLALTIMVAPMYAPYNQVLLVPAILVLVRGWAEVASRGCSRRLGYLALMFAGVWQWVATLTLSTVYLLGYSEWALDRWKWPFFATFALPVLVFALILMEVQPRTERGRGITAR
jgi:MFS family permease